MKQINFYSSKDNVDDFVGAKISETKIDFYFPLGLEFRQEDINECRRKALTVLFTASLATKSNKRSRYSQDYAGSSQDSFNSLLFIIQDYNKNGLYSLKKKDMVKGYDGRINWKRTLQLAPLIAYSNSIYLEPIAEKISSTDTIITSIHKYCIEVAIEKIGWIFSIENKWPVSEISDEQKIYYEHVLINELRTVFEDRKKILLNHLLRIIRSTLGKNQFSDNSELGTYEYHTVWERMIQAVYGNLPLEDFFPSATWYLPGRDAIKSSKLRPDTIMQLNRSLYILDAKYYKFGVFPENAAFLPNSDSIQKQITYGDHAALRFSNRFPGGIKNVFIIPFYGKEQKIQYAGYALPGWREVSSGHRKVHLLLLDTEYLIQKFKQHVNNIDSSLELISAINGT